METMTLRHRSSREMSHCDLGLTNPTPAAAREKRSPEGKGAATPHSRQPLRRVTPSIPAAGVTETMWIHPSIIQTALPTLETHALGCAKRCQFEVQ
jgi:hypothetical protein